MDKPVTSAARSEVGAIETIELFEPSDKQSFSPKEAVEWLKQSGAARYYVVDLFALPLDGRELADYPKGRRTLVDSFVAGLNSLGIGVAVARSKLAGGRQHYYVLVKMLESEGLAGDLFKSVEDAWGSQPSDLDPGAHGVLLRFLAAHPLVRKIHLPPIVRQHVQSGMRPFGKKAPIPARDPKQRYPRIGVIDGGISKAIGPWLIGKDGFLGDKHRDLDHGTFIAGLLVSARGCGNSDEVARELDGCEVYDIDLFPDSRITGAFEQYHPQGFQDFLDALNVAIETAKAKHGIRIFNLSINVVQEVDADKYGVFAELLDQIAAKHDAIIVISAGNLETAKSRAPWPKKPKEILKYLAARTTTDKLLQPAESVFALTVTAINPPGLTQHPSGAPTTYTRKGPGMEVGVKPDFSHYSGAGPELLPGHGLYSIDDAGAITSSMGTSFAAPLVAKSLAVLESRINSYVPRETLIALMVHFAQVPDAAKDLDELARHFVGFGVPASSSDMLSTSDSAITMVFSGKTAAKQWLEFSFNWPKTLTASGSCRISADMTLVYRPFIDPRFAAEFLRVNLDASLLQYHGRKDWSGELKQLFTGKSDNDHVSEKELIAHGLKWWPIKHYRRESTKFVGKSSDWKLRVQSLLRDGEGFPEDGVPFTVILTVRDPDGKRPIFQEMKQWLTANGVQCGDITAGIQLRARQ